MERKDEKLFTVGELARRCGVTVRTLQYYDSEGLLSPRHYTEGGRRLYAREDVMLLQQILFLKSFGFSLEEIRDRLMHIDSPEQISQLLTRQRDALTEQSAKLANIIEVLSKTIEETKNNGYLSTEKLVAIMEMMKEGSPYSFILRYFNQKEMKNFVKWFDDESRPEGVSPEWQEPFTEMIGLYKAGANPEGPKGQNLAAKWWALVMDTTGGDPELLKTLMTLGNDVENWPDQAGDFKQAIKDFLSKAIERYLKDSGIMPERG